MNLLIEITAMRNLYIATNKFSALNRSRLHALDYNKWVKYIESNSSYFIWYSDTESGRRLAESITNMPIEKRQTYLHLLSKYRCEAGYDSKKGYNLIDVTFHKELRYISIYFERNPKIEELRRFLDMAKHLNASLLIDGKKVIDEKFIDVLEKQQNDKKEKSPEAEIL